MKGFIETGVFDVRKYQFEETFRCYKPLNNFNSYSTKQNCPMSEKPQEPEKQQQYPTFYTENRVGKDGISVVFHGPKEEVQAYREYISKELKIQFPPYINTFTIQKI